MVFFEEKNKEAKLLPFEVKLMHVLSKSEGNSYLFEAKISGSVRLFGAQFSQ
uniref:Uncharacterized protein n=1 Tax=Solanum lycopersicum TaxID=4081 RepID=A0A3Q7FTG2_SOLLC